MEKLNILCGASLFALEAIEKSGIKFHYVCDADSSKAGNLWGGEIGIINYNKVGELLEKCEINIFLANRFVTDTMKRLQCYIKRQNFKIYAFISQDLTETTEISSMYCYFEKSGIIKKTINAVNAIVRCRHCIDDQLLIYTMAKTGTTSMRIALEKAKGGPLLYSHTMNQSLGFSDVGGINDKLGSKTDWCDIDSVMLYYGQAIEIIKNSINKGKKVKIITSAREPVARNISFMFFTLPLMFSKNADIAVHKYAFTEIFEYMYYKMIDHDYVLNWFDSEIKACLGIDIYEYPFDKEKGYVLIEKDNVELLVLKMEKLDNCAQIIKEFTGVNEFTLERENSSENYWYKPVYDKFKEKFIPDKEYLEHMYESKFMHYFYSDDEIKGFYEKYKK